MCSLWKDHWFPEEGEGNFEAVAFEWLDSENLWISQILMHFGYEYNLCPQGVLGRVAFHLYQLTCARVGLTVQKRGLSPATRSICSDDPRN